MLCLLADSYRNFCQMVEMVVENYCRLLHVTQWCFRDSLAGQVTKWSAIIRTPSMRFGPKLGNFKDRLQCRSAVKTWKSRSCSHPVITALHSSHWKRHVAQAPACVAQLFWDGTDRANHTWYTPNISKDEQAAMTWRANLWSMFALSCCWSLAAKKAEHQSPDWTDYSASPSSVAFRPSTSTLVPKRIKIFLKDIKANKNDMVVDLY